MLQQFLIQTRKGCGTLEHDVGGKLSLLGDPVVVHAVEQMLHQRIDSARQGGEDSRPVPFGEPVGESLGASGVLDPQERVVDFAVGDLEALAALHGREDAHEPLGDLVALGDGPDPILLADGAGQVNIRPFRPGSHRFGVLLDVVGLGGNKPPEVLDAQALVGYESFHGLRPSQG